MSTFCAFTWVRHFRMLSAFLLVFVPAHFALSMRTYVCLHTFTVHHVPYYIQNNREDNTTLILETCVCTRPFFLFSCFLDSFYIKALCICNLLVFCVSCYGGKTDGRRGVSQIQCLSWAFVCERVCMTDDFEYFIRFQAHYTQTYYRFYGSKYLLLFSPFFCLCCYLFSRAYAIDCTWHILMPKHLLHIFLHTPADVHKYYV